MAAEVFDVIIIGSGAVGCAVAREMALLGQKCIILEKNMDIINEASSGNTGHLGSNFYYTEARAPLEYRMTRKARLKHNPEWLNTQINVPRRKCGLFMIATNDEEFEYLIDIESKGRVNGEDIRILHKAELELMEPNLNSQEIIAALYSPEEYTVDPFLMVLSNLYVALHHGCQLHTRSRVVDLEKGRDKKGQKVWKVHVEKRLNSDGGKLSKSIYLAKKVVNCGGNYSDVVDLLLPRSIDEGQPFLIQPGRGEYVVFEPSEKGPKGLVTQVPSKKYAGLYIFQSVYGHLIVGPTNIIQDSKEDRGCSVESVALLESHFYKYFPELNERKIIATYSGLRPRSKENNDYQIRFNDEKTFATLGAIRSTGLTASRAIAEYCAQNLFPLEEYDSFLPRKQDVVMPAPEICKDGVNLQVGQFKFKLTHKLSQLGLTSTLHHNSTSSSKPQSSL